MSDCAGHSGPTATPIRGVVYRPLDVAAEPLGARLRDRGWSIEECDDPYRAMIALCLLDQERARLQARGEEAGPVALVIAEPPCPDTPAARTTEELLRAVKRYVPLVTRWFFHGDTLVPLDDVTPGVAPAASPPPAGPPPASPPPASPPPAGPSAPAFRPAPPPAPVAPAGRSQPFDLRLVEADGDAAPAPLTPLGEEDDDDLGPTRVTAEEIELLFGRDRGEQPVR